MDRIIGLWILDFRSRPLRVHPLSPFFSPLVIFNEGLPSASYSERNCTFHCFYLLEHRFHNTINSDITNKINIKTPSTSALGSIISLFEFYRRPVPMPCRRIGNCITRFSNDAPFKNCEKFMECIRKTSRNRLSPRIFNFLPKPRDFEI